MAEAEMALQYGADALGLVGPMPSGPGILPLDLIGEISKALPPTLPSFYLTSKVIAEDIREEYEIAQTTTIQMVDKVPVAELLKLRKLLPPSTQLVQVLHVRNDEVIQEALRVQPHVDALLLDSGDPDATIKTLGGTGRTHNWSISRRLVETVQKPVFLAGGLRSENVQKAYAVVRPHGLDLCSGVRSDGKLDEMKLKAFFCQVGGLTR